MFTYTILAFATGAAAQYSTNPLPSNPGGALPAGVQAPNSGGLSNITVQPSRGGLAVCVSGYVSVEASTSQNINVNYELPQNQTEATNTWVEIFSSGSTLQQQINGGTQNVSGTYDIAATLCTPANNTSPDQVQFLTHGIGFDRYYWDFAPGYSYVDVAAQYGHASFLYDRLGVGQSSHPDPLTVIQAPLEIEIANILAQKLRDGAFSNHAFKTVVGAGHSFGSIITQAVTSQYPETLDGAILTGFSVNGTGMAPFNLGSQYTIASQDQPYRFSSLSPGYLIPGTPASLQTGFFRAPTFDPAILNLVWATSNTVTWGEIFTLGLVTKPAPRYTRPIAVVDGDNDLGFCDGNCSWPVNKAAQVFTALYPNANATGTYLAPATGHALNVHYSAVAAYHYIQDFIGKNVH